MEVKELELKLAEMKTGLEAVAQKAASDSAKTEVAAQLKAVNDLIEEAKKGAVPEGINLKEMQEKLEATIKGFDEFQAYVKNNAKATEQKNKTFATVLKEAVEEKTDDFAKMARGDKSVKGISIDLDLKAVGDMSTANVTGSAVWGAIARPGIIELPKRKVHMRQILNGGSVGAGTDFYFMKQNGNGEGAPAFVAEGASKPQTDEDLVESSVKIETLAVWERITKKAMNNVPGMLSFLQSRLLEKIYKAEDAAILYGDGTSPNIKGILTAGNFTASTSAATVFAEKLIDDIATLEDTHERDANIIVMRPQQYYGFFKNKASGSGEYDLPQNVIIVGGQLYINGILCVPTTALNINDLTTDTTDYFVADLSGAQFLTQESLKIEFFEQDADNVTKNKVTIRAEETVALPVFGSNYFIKGTQNVAI